MPDDDLLAVGWFFCNWETAVSQLCEIRFFGDVR